MEKFDDEEFFEDEFDEYDDYDTTCDTPYFVTFEARKGEIEYAISRESIGVNDGPYGYELIGYDELQFSNNSNGIAFIKIRIVNVENFPKELSYFGDEELSINGYVDLSSAEKDKYAKKVTLITLFTNLFPEYYDSDILKDMLRNLADTIYDSGQNDEVFIDVPTTLDDLLTENEVSTEKILEKINKMKQKR